MQVNRAGADWLLIKRFIGEEIEAARSRLEDPLDPASTQYERGYIAGLRALLNHVEPVLTPVMKDENYG